MTGYPPPALDNIMLRSEAEIGQNSSISILSVKTYVELLVELKYNIFCGPLCNTHCQGWQQLGQQSTKLGCNITKGNKEREINMPRV